MQQEQLIAPEGTSSVEIEGIPYQADANGRVTPLTPGHAETLKRLGFRTGKERTDDRIEAAAPNPDEDTIENMTAWLIDRGVNVPDWRELLAANVRRVVELQKAGVIPGPHFEDMPAEPEAEKTPAPDADDKRGVAQVPPGEDGARKTGLATEGDASKIVTVEDAQKGDWADLKAYLKREGVAVAGNASRLTMVSLATRHIEAAAAEAEKTAAEGQGGDQAPGQGADQQGGQGAAPDAAAG